MGRGESGGAGRLRGAVLGGGAEEGRRDAPWSRGLGDVYERQVQGGELG